MCPYFKPVAEHDVLRDMGVNLLQGYLLAKPETAALPAVSWVRAAADEARR